MYSFVQEIDKQPLLDTNLYMFNYFVVFVVVGVFVCANLLVGILIKQMLRDGSLTKSLKGSTASLPKLNRSRSISTENLTVNGNENDRVCIPSIDWLPSSCIVRRINALKTYVGAPFLSPVLGADDNTRPAPILRVDSIRHLPRLHHFAGIRRCALIAAHRPLDRLRDSNSADRRDWPTVALVAPRLFAQHLEFHRCNHRHFPNYR